MPDYFVGFFRFDHDSCKMLFCLPILLVFVQSHPVIFKITTRMEMDPVLTTLVFYQMIKIDWSSSGVPDAFVPYYLATRALVVN